MMLCSLVVSVIDLAIVAGRTPCVPPNANGEKLDEDQRCPCARFEWRDRAFYPTRPTAAEPRGYDEELPVLFLTVVEIETDNG
jgi:hypothetical protein